MSRDASVTLDWADGTYTFRFGIEQLQELQEKCDAGPAWVYARMESDTWLLPDVRETLRLGLIGGGLAAGDALKLVRRYVVPPLVPHLRPAREVLAAVLVGVPDEPLKKSEGAETTSESSISPTESSASAPSMDAEQSWDSLPATSGE